jgi:hypothetical protein
MDMKEPQPPLPPMNKNRIHSDNMKLVYRADMLALLNEIKDGEAVYTNHFENEFKDGRKYWQFAGKHCRPHLIKCLRTLEADGYITNIVIKTKVHQWQITDSGLWVIQLQAEKNKSFKNSLS